MIGLWFQKSKWGKVYKFILMDKQTIFFQTKYTSICAYRTILKLDSFTKLAWIMDFTDLIC